MIIYGLGSDIANENRLRSILKKNKSFKQRIFSKSEIILCDKKAAPSGVDLGESIISFN